MNGRIIKLDIKDYYKCNNIWNMYNRKELIEGFYNELKNGNLITFIYVIDGEYFGEVSLVFDMNDSDYAISSKRIYLSRFNDIQEYGFDRILDINEDEQGKYLKLLKVL